MLPQSIGSSSFLAPSGLSARVSSVLPYLGPSERRVAEVVLERGSEVVEWSTLELAAAAGTSAATVVRACQALGFRGFQHLRLELARAGVPVVEQAGDPVERLFREAGEALAASRRSVDAEAISAAVAALHGAGRVVLVGSGFSAPPLQDAALRFATIGRPVEAPVDVLGQQFAAHSLTVGDVCLALSYSGANAHTLAACRNAQSGGARVIAVSSFVRAPLARLADISLTTGSLGEAHAVDPFLSRLAHHLVLHALHSGLAERLGSPDPSPMREVVAQALEDSSGG